MPDAPAVPSRGFGIHVGRRRLEARRWDVGTDANAPALLLLHEGLGSVDLWRDFPATLAEATGRAALAWSRAGHGRSASCDLPRPLDYMEREATLLPDVLDALGVRRAILIGHSDGGSIAALAGCLPEVAGLVLIAPHFFVEDCSVATIAEARRAYETGNLRLRLARHHDHVDAAFRGWSDSWLDPGFRDWDISDCLDRIRCPVLAIQGANDPYGTRAQIDAVTARVADARVCLIAGARHAPHLERPDEALRAMSAFVAEIR